MVGKILTRKEKETIAIMENSGKILHSVDYIKDKRNVTYPAVYKMLERMKNKGIVVDVWEEKGYKKYYRLK